MADNDTRIEFVEDDGSVTVFDVIEEASLGGVSYLLVSLSGADEEEAYIMKRLADENGECLYEEVSDEKELAVISDYFNSLLDDVEIER